MISVDAAMKWKRIRTWSAQLVDRCDRLGLVSMKRWIGMDKNEHAFLPILFERGTDETVLIIAFSGGAQKLDVPVYQFFETSKTLGYNRILLRDRHNMFYHHGVDRRRRDWRSLIDYLEQEIARLSPKKTLCVGTSSGGYAAIIAGYHLKADFVHAFGPQTKIAIDRTGIRNARHPVRRWRMSVSRRVLRQVLDLAPMLRQCNGKTRYFVHYGTGHAIDRNFAERVSQLPAVTTLGYPCSAHAIAIFLAKNRFLDRLLIIENQDRLAELARHHFGGQVRITLPSLSAVSPGGLLSEDIRQGHLLTT